MDLAFDQLHWDRVGFDVEPLYPAKGAESLPGPTWIYWKLVGTDLSPLFPAQQLSPPSDATVSPFGGGSGKIDQNQMDSIPRRGMIFDMIRVKLDGEIRSRSRRRIQSVRQGAIPVLRRNLDTFRTCTAKDQIHLSLVGSSIGASDPFSAKETALLMALFNGREPGRHGVSNGKA